MRVRLWVTDRHHRQQILPAIGDAGQMAIARSHVMVFGAGALGCPCMDLLARAGVGRLSIVDRDIVDLTNLQRQTLFAQADVGMPKVEAAERRILAIDQSLRVEALAEDVTFANAEQIVRVHPKPDVIIDCTDNFTTRYLLNDVCVKLDVPLVYGGSIGMRGMQMTIIPRRTACMRCVFPQPPENPAQDTCDTAGIFAPVSAIIGATQAADAIKLLVYPEALSGTLLTFDLWSNTRSRLDLKDARDPSCPCCGLGMFEFLAGQHSEQSKVMCGRNSVQIMPMHALDISLDDLFTRLTRVGSFTRSSQSVMGTLADGTPMTIFSDGRAIVGNTTDPVTAKGVYAKYVGA